MATVNEGHGHSHWYFIMHFSGVYHETKVERKSINVSMQSSDTGVLFTHLHMQYGLGITLQCDLCGPLTHAMRFACSLTHAVKPRCSSITNNVV